MIDAGIVGLGWWGKNLVEAVQGKSDRLRFVRGACRDIRPVAAFAERHGLGLSSSLTDLLADENVEAVVLATPHSLHAEQIIVSAEARKPVFCEKPLALTRDDAARVIDACRRHGVVLALGENNRFWPEGQWFMPTHTKLRSSKYLNNLIRGSSGYDVPASRPNYASSLERSTPGLKVVASGTRMLVLPIGTGTTWGGKFSASPPDGMARRLRKIISTARPVLLDCDHRRISRTVRV